jgi:hypothetical protein
MSVAQSVAEVLRDHVTLSVEGIDRMYLNVYVPRLQTDVGVSSFFRFHRGHTFASSVLMEPISRALCGCHRGARRGPRDSHILLAHPLLEGDECSGRPCPGGSSPSPGRTGCDGRGGQGVRSPVS